MIPYRTSGALRPSLDPSPESLGWLHGGALADEAAPGPGRPAASVPEVDLWMMRWFELTPAPMALVNLELDVIRANDAALRFADTSPDIGLRNGAFFARRREDSERLRNIGARTSAERTTTSILGDSVVVARRLSPSGPIMLFLKRPGSLETLDCDVLDSPFGLTEAEWRIILLTVKGQSPSEIARGQVKSLHTVRTHMKRIYAKLGVQTKEQLFSKLIDLLLALRQAC